MKTIAITIMLCLLASPLMAGYTIVQIPKIEPQWIVAQGATGPESRLNPGPERLPPVGGLQRLYQDLSGLYGDDPTKRVELWESTAGTATSDEIAPYIAKIRDRQIAAIWQAATNWQEQYISGVAIGLLTLGVIQGKPKASAVMQWTGAIWSEYYRRKDIVLSGGQPETDFTGLGPIPYSVPELRAELGM